MAPPGESLFEAVRAACSPATWSRGVELTRARAVVGERLGADEAVFRVTTRGGMSCPQVTLFPASSDWDCECGSREGACEHVAAAVIAWRRAAEEGQELPDRAAATGRVGYRFSRAGGALAFERVILEGGRPTPLEATLAAIAAGRVDGPQFQATQDDLAVELVLGTHRRGLLPPRLAERLFAPLARAGEIALDGRPVGVAAEPLLPRARLEDDGDGFRLWVEPDPSVTERFSNGVVLCGDTLRVVGESGLTGRERHELERGRRFGPDEVAELVTDVLPALARRIPLDVRTTRLPETVRSRPRIQLEVQRSGRTLSVLGTLVYGDPPAARVNSDRLVLLQGPVPVRDRQAERNELQRLARLGLAPGVRAEFTAAEAVAFRSRLARWPGSVRGEGLDDFTLAPPLVPRLVLDAERFAVEFESPGDAALPGQAAGSRRADPQEVLRAWRASESLVPLLSGGWAPLPADWMRRFGHRVADLLEARDAEGRLPRCSLGDLAALCRELDEPPPSELGVLERWIDGFAGIPAASLPADLATPLRPYQRAGVDWLVLLRESGLGALLADDMGLGKTLQALCAIRPPALVVAPTSVLHGWADEIARHRPALSFALYHGPRRELDPAAEVTLTTYTLLRLDAERLAARRWGTVVLDEAQNIKNPESQVAGAAFRLEADFRVALTGTPVENRLDELWSQFHFIDRGLLGGRRDFQERYAEPIARGDAAATARLRARIRPFMLRRLKREVAAELPPRTEMVLRCELSDEEREVYDAIRAATLNEVVSRLDTGGGNVLAALEALLRLRQAACHRGLVPGQEAADSSKVRLLVETLDSVIAEGHKALIFSQWTSLLDRTEPHLRAAGMEFLRLDGATRDRAAVVRAFQDAGGPPLMLISLKAGGTGLNLTAADHIFLLDPWWNPAVEDQAADRAHRIGQLRPVMIYRLVAEGTVEERILSLQERKRALVEAALGGSGTAEGLTRADLLALLG